MWFVLRPTCHRSVDYYYYIITDDTRAHVALQLHINSTDLLTARGVAHLVVHGTSGSTSYETIPPVRLETSGGVLSTVDMLVQRRDGRRRLRELDDYFSRKLLLVVTLLLCLNLSYRHSPSPRLSLYPHFTSTLHGPSFRQWIQTARAEHR